MNEEYYDGDQQRRNSGSGGDDGDVPKPSRKLPEPRSVDRLLDRVDQVLDSNLDRQYRQPGGE